MPVRRRVWPARVALIVLVLALAAALFDSLVSAVDAAPRTLGPYLRDRLSDHHPLLAGAGEGLMRLLDLLDRGEYRAAQPSKLLLGARAQSAASSPVGARHVFAASVEDILLAIRQAQPGDVITLAPGTYRFADGPIAVRQPGTPQAPITVRAARAGTVLLEFVVAEGILVAAPHWTFENLSMRGACTRHPDCEHAFHVVGRADHFIARNNTLTDFNSHIKINGQDRRFPDDGLIEGNTLSNTTPRETDGPVTPIDLVAASRWTIRANVITDFVKAQGDRISYGAYAKGGGSDNRFERNIVWCEYLLRGTPGWRVGLSLGGGGTQPSFCRDSECVTEQSTGVIESNLVAACSDDGIYANRAAVSRIVHNTLVDTGGIVVRFAESSADVQGNLVDGAIRSRDGGALHAKDNLSTALTRLYLGSHPQRSLFRDPLALDFAWRSSPPRRDVVSEPSPDLCGMARSRQPVYGAFEDFAMCVDNGSAAAAPP